MVKKSLETDKHFVDLLGSSKIGYGIGNGVVVFKAKQGRQFFLLKLIHANTHVVRQNEIEEYLLLSQVALKGIRKIRDCRLNCVDGVAAVGLRDIGRKAQR